MASLTHNDGIAILDLGDGENRFTPDWMVEVAQLLDDAIASDSSVLVTTASSKIWSNGLDLEWVQANPTEFQPYVSRAQRVMARFLEAPMPTVAAISGHAFAAGAMLSLCHDQRVMRSDRGFWCLPEVDLNLPFTPGMNALITARLTPQAANVAMTLGHRFTGEAALVAGIVDEIARTDEVLPQAMARARAMVGKNPEAIGRIKARLYEPVLEALRQND
jgi:enoyl-CoA hydratase/carnithine racemase